MCSASVRTLRYSKEHDEIRDCYIIHNLAGSWLVTVYLVVNHSFLFYHLGTTHGLKMFKFLSNKCCSCVLPITCLLANSIIRYVMTFSSFFAGSSPVDNRLRSQTGMTHLCKETTDMLILNSLKVGVGEEDCVDNIFLAFDFNKVTDIICMLATDRC